MHETAETDQVGARASGGGASGGGAGGGGAGTVVLVGTRKGLWVGRSDERREDWRWSGPHAPMTEVYAALVEPRSAGGPPRLWAATASSWLGPALLRSDDLGETWVESPGPRFPDDVDASVERVWQLQPGARAGELWAGTEPGAVFRSRDDGESWELVRGLWDHPHRQEWGEGFGGQAFHTLLPHPSDPDRLVAAISTGGVYATTDGGATWSPRNRGIKAEFFPAEAHYPEFGQCVHKVARHPARPERLFLQNHGGVYRSDDEGASWQSVAAGLPSEFGFPVVVHPHRPDAVHVFPLDGGEGRFPPAGRARVWRSADAGATWEAHDEGLPDGFWVGVVRDAMTADDHDRAGLWLGARNGSVWRSVDDGRWHEVARGLPDVMCLRAARC